MLKSAKYWVSGIAIYVAAYFAIHLKNLVQVGHFYLVINGDSYDSLFDYLSMPGEIVSFIGIVVVFRNIHNYPFVFSETISLVSNCVIYGAVSFLICRLFRKHGNKYERVSAKT
jgi:hypothetical protein